MALADGDLHAALPAPPAGRILIGYSGGLDSRVLLQLARERYGAAVLTAIHVHHGLSPNADAWQRHCQATCAALEVPCQVERIRVAPGSGGLEARARAARYRVFARWLEAGDLLLLAHHADDQAETLLYRLLRTGRPAGMPAARRLGRGRLARPLLGFPRARLRAFALARGLCWIEDETNAALYADRNQLRHRVLPALAERWPDVAQRLCRAADQAAAAARLQRELAELDLGGLGERAERVGRSLELDALLRLPGHRRDNLLRHWLPAPDVPEPGAGALATLMDDLVPAAADAAPLVSWPGGQWRRFRHRLYLLPAGWGAAPPAAGGSWRWSPDEPLALPDGAVLSARPVRGRGLRAGGELRVRYRRGGERARPPGRAASNTLKKILQEQGLEPWLRDRVPLIERAGRLVAVGDLFVCAEAAAGPGESGWLPHWEYPRPE
ncbi:MAG: tRNA lysidine(34) synthetase TilS [Pseudomonadota bacterium]